MTWAATLKHYNEMLDSFTLKLFRDLVPQHLELFRQGSAAAAGQLVSSLSMMLLARGSAFVRQELEPLKHILPQSVAAYVAECEGDYALSSMILEYANIANLFEIVGIGVPSTVLDSFRSPLLRIETHRHDITPDHWTKALLSIALNEPLGWLPIAGLHSPQQISFVPGATFQFNMQGLIAYLGVAMQKQEAIEAVLPAWHQFVEVAPTLESTRQINDEVILWVARNVFHDIGKLPLGDVGDRVSAEIARVV